VEQEAVDLKKEQAASKARPRYDYSALARFFFRSMDVLAGPTTTLGKAKLVEALAPVPYRAWENREYARLTHHHGDEARMQQARAIAEWGREAQDNEYQHLLVINEKLKEDAAKDRWYMTPPLPTLMVGSYAVISWTMARVDIRRAFLLNAEFEDHAEHYYAQLVDEHPEWEDQPVTSEVVQEYGSFRSWADVFRRVGLDERDHMNNSFVFAGRPEHVVEYEGMPATKGAEPPAA
jgi:ubiquinol oxidase